MKDKKKIMADKNFCSNGLDIAIVGYSCRFPKAKDAEEYWKNLINGVDCVSEISNNKWDVDEFYSKDVNDSEKTYCRSMGILEDIDKFDPRFFNISPKEATEMDPSQRILMQEAWKCIENSGIPLENIQKSRTGVYIGAVSIDGYHSNKIDSQTGTGSYYFLLANRISYFLNLSSESQTLDTGCSSSFYALNCACRAIKEKSIDCALVGGVNLHFSPYKYILWSKSRMLSPTGKCHSFDKNADGYISGEGCAVIMLKALSKAIEDNDIIYAVIKGCATNHGGKGVSMTAPNVPAQKAVIEAAYSQTNFTPETVNYIEAHGTGTSLGDPIEFEALKQTFEKYYSKKKYCKIGSVKTNIGHLEGCSSLASLIKVIMMMKYKMIPKTLNLIEVNPIIDIKNSPFEFASEPSEWCKINDETPRRAGISSFGFGGANAHVILEEYNNDFVEIDEESDDEYLFLLSAKSSKSLNKMIEAWKNFVKKEDFDKVSINEIHNCLLAGREHFSYRLGFCVNKKDDIREKINNIVFNHSDLKEKKYFILKEKKYIGFNSISKKLVQTPQFIHSISNLKKQIEKLENGRIICKEFFCDYWKDENKAFFSTLMDYVIVSTLLSFGVEPGILAAEGNAIISMLLVANAMSIKEAELVFKNNRSICFKRPVIPFYDQKSNKVIYSGKITREYFYELINNIILSGDILNQYIEKAVILYSNQYTFRRYIDEWKDCFEKDFDFEKCIRNLSFESSDIHVLGDKLLYMLMIKSSINKVYTKWKLSDELEVIDKYFSKLIVLVNDDVFEKKDIAYCILNPLDDAQIDDVLKRANKRLEKLSLKNNYPFLLKQKLDEIEDSSLWLNAVESTSLPEEVLDNGIIINVLDERSLYESLLYLWLNGKNIDWKLLVNKENFKKCQLPCYIFDEQSYWIPQTFRSKKENIFIGAKEDNYTCSYNFSGNEFVFKDHKIDDKCILPGTAHIEMACESFIACKNRTVISVRDVVWRKPYIQNESMSKLYITFSEASDNSNVYEIWNYNENNKRIIFSNGKISYALTDSIHDFESNRKLSKIEFDFSNIQAKEKNEIYNELADSLFYYGDSFRTIEYIKIWNNEAMSKLKAPDIKNYCSEAMFLNPMIIDGALQTAMCCKYGYCNNKLPHIPFSINEITIFKPLDNNIICHTWFDHEDGLCCDLYNEDGSICVSISGIVLREYSNQSENKDNEHLMFSEWKKTEQNSQPVRNEENIIVIYNEFESEIKKHFFDYYYEKNVSYIHVDKIQTKLKTILLNQNVDTIYFLPGLVKNVKHEISVESIEKAQETGVISLLDTIHILMDAKYGTKNLMIKAATSKAVKVIDDELTSPEFASLHGILLAVASEFSNWKICCLDLDMDNEVLDNIKFILKTNQTSLNRIAAFRKGNYYENVLLEKKDINSLKDIYRNKGVYVIIGGNGGVGYSCACDLAEKYHASIALIGHSDFDNEKQNKIDHLISLGGDAIYVKADITDHTQIKIGFDSVIEKFGNINGVIHSAMYLHDKLIVNMTRNDFIKALNTKTLGCFNVGDVCRKMKLDFMVFFSSIESYLVLPGQSNYISGCHFEDAFALYANDNYDFPVKCINWGFWGEIGAASSDFYHKYFSGIGLLPMKTRRGLEILKYALSSTETQILYIEANDILMSKLFDKKMIYDTEKSETDDYKYLTDTIKTILSDVLQGNYDDFDDSVPFTDFGVDSIIAVEVIEMTNKRLNIDLKPTDLFNYTDINSLCCYIRSNYNNVVNMLESHEVDKKGNNDMTFDLYDYLVDIIKGILSDMLQVKKNEIDEASPFTDLGVDSIIAVEIIEKINRKLTISLRPTDLFNYTYIESLCDYILDNYKEDIMRLFVNTGKNSSVISKMSSDQIKDNNMEISDDNDGIAVIGIACRFPDADNKDEFWENLACAKNSVREVTRWKTEAYYSENEEEIGKSYSKWAAMIDDYEKFDPLFFNISPKEAELMDPQQRIFLEEAWNAFEDSGYSKNKLNGLRCSVYVGCSQGDYVNLFEKNEVEPQAYSLLGNTQSVLPARLSYFLNLKGAAVAVDTACSSSLVALHLACEELNNGVTDMSVVGGTSVLVTPKYHVLFSKSNMLSHTGRCHTFDQAADGFVPGEGAGVVILKRLKDAIRDNDHIYGIIRATGVNQDGKTNGITAPNSLSQAELEESVYRKANVDPTDITYVETHGTGTKLGDPIEIDALTKSFRIWTDKKQYCSIGSVKTNIGHTLVTAGIAGLIKILLCMENKKLVPSVGFNNPNNLIDFKSSPFYVNTEYCDWIPSDSGKRIAALSSFGFSGTNAHIVVEEYVPSYESDPKEMIDIYPVVFSAKTEKALREEYFKFIKWYEKHKNNVSIENICYTLLVCRTRFVERSVFWVNSSEELYSVLNDVLNGKSIDNYKRSTISNKVKTDSVIKNEESDILAAEILKKDQIDWITNCFLLGYDDLDWELIGRKLGGRVISMPTYPFNHEKYMIDMVDKNKALESQLHPLLHKNVSTIFEQRFITVFHKDDYIVRDHKIWNKNILPGAAYLEMAYQAGCKSTGKKINGIDSVIWAKPIIVTSEITASVEIIPENGRLNANIYTLDLNGNKEVHAQCRLSYSDACTEPCKSINIENIIKRMDYHKNGTECYKAYYNSGYEYGKTFCSIEEIFGNSNESVAKLKIDKSEIENAYKYGIHPILIDGAFQSVCGIEKYRSNLSYLPFSISKLIIYDELHSNCYAYTVKKNNHVSEKFAKFDIVVVDETGKVIVEMNDFTIALGNSESKASNNYFTQEWKKSDKNKALINTPERFLFINCHNIIKDSFKNSISVELNESFVENNNYSYVINKYNEDDYNILFDRLITNSIIPECIVYECENVVSDTEEALWDSIYTMFLLNKAIAHKKISNKILIIFLCRSGDKLLNSVYFAMSGFSKSFYQEKSNIINKIVQIPFDIENNKIHEILKCEACLSDSISEVEIKYENGERYVKTNIPVILNSDNNYIRENGIYIITGGAGGIGYKLAEYLTKKYRAKVVLTGRTSLNDNIAKKLEYLKNEGADTFYIQADATSYEDMKNVISTTGSRFGKINGIFNLVGVLKDSLTINKKFEEFSAVIKTKVLSCLIIDELTKAINLDFIMLFSSIAGIMGNLGQGDYAFGNHFMDIFAKNRNILAESGKRFGKTISVDWPLFKNGGMNVNEQVEKWIKEKYGLVTMDLNDGLECIESILSSGYSNCIVANGKIDYIYKSLSIIVDKEETSSESSYDDTVEQIKRICSEVIKVPYDDLDIDVDFAEYGVDSICMMSILNRVEKLYGKAVDASSISDNNTIEAFSRYLISNGIVNDNNTEKKKIINNVIRDNFDNNIKLLPRFNNIEKNRSNKIAVIGAACRFADSDDLEQYWSNLINEKDLINERSLERWKNYNFYDKNESLSGKSYSKNGGLLKDIYEFDNDYFNISEADALVMDPHQRFMLELTAELLANAGYNKNELSHSRTGVFIGGGDSCYTRQDISNIPVQSRNHIVVDTIQNMISARISDYYNFIGPSMVLDTACSSSLVAIHQACNSILNGESEYAIAGGVELHITPDYFINFCQAKVVSKRGIPAVFDEKADGMVLGEGAGVVLLKDYEKALADGDRIYGVIIGSAINNDGHTMGITVPSQEGQKDVIRRAIDISGISPETITYLEAHGTGTLLGDPIEIRSTEQVYKEYTDKHQFCGVGSVKSNMGHLLRASGIASFIKVLLSLNYKMIPATLHIENPHPRFKFEQSPFYPVRHTQEWNPDADIRRAGISSFGFGGTNCHIIIEEMKGQKFIKRYPLPKIKFNKKQFDIAKKIEEYSFLSKLFDDLEKGYIHTDDAIAQLEKNNFMT